MASLMHLPLFWIMTDCHKQTNYGYNSDRNTLPILRMPNVYNDEKVRVTIASVPQERHGHSIYCYELH